MGSNYELASEIEAAWSAWDVPTMLNLGVLTSGEAGRLQAELDAQSEDMEYWGEELNYRIRQIKRGTPPHLAAGIG